MKQVSAKINMNIVNLNSEKRKFLFDPFYNPQFIYDEDIDPARLVKHGEVSGEYLALATKILDTVIKKFGSEESFITESEGPVISREQTEKSIQAYLQMSGIDKRVKLSFSNQYIARTSIQHEAGQFHIRARLPIDYREKNLLPILHHEVGTHIFRWLNEENQPWHESRASFHWTDYTETEEGLAVLHTMLAHPEPYLWIQSLYYFAAYHAQSMSFAELGQKLKPYVSSLERRWKMCLRVKRGFTDTSVPGAYTKDKVYLVGAIKVARWLIKNDFEVEKLYVGKIAVEDLEKAWSYSQTYEPILPQFVTSKKAYQATLEQVFKQNHLMEYLHV